MEKFNDLAILEKRKRINALIDLNPKIEWDVEVMDWTCINCNTFDLDDLQERFYTTKTKLLRKYLLENYPNLNNIDLIK